MPAPELDGLAKTVAVHFEVGGLSGYILSEIIDRDGLLVVTRYPTLRGWSAHDYVLTHLPTGRGLLRGNQRLPLPLAQKLLRELAHSPAIDWSTIGAHPTTEQEIRVDLIVQDALAGVLEDRHHTT